jgi:hypothetical protein
MKRIAYAGGSFLTGDRIADAILDYAAVLARSGQSDHVRVPGFGNGDALLTFDLVLGPASQILAEPVGDPRAELEDDAVIGHLATLGRRARAGRVGEPDPPAPS